MTTFERGFYPRVTIHDGKAVERALAPPSLLESGVRLKGAVVEATFAATDAPLVQTLRDRGVPFVVDPQTVRFVTEAYRAVDRLRRLPYAPAAPLDPSLGDAQVRHS